MNKRTSKNSAKMRLLTKDPMGELDRIARTVTSEWRNNLLRHGMPDVMIGNHQAVGATAP
ncbi:hypothetical protein [Tardiphaga sp. 42S5]|uniref:hypothetical protein n=1 Tax=Tardiphaga sp. 42S5 TaxID=1404799 RepID=UPI002A59FC70|nr:hypothetical protein [Tardiphaga sp. 42S5]WPO43228.1 hypothetical protein SFY93_08825 [Tardiphaga sp. 42S5]